MPPKKEPVDPRLEAIRIASRLPALPNHESFSKVARECVAALARHLGDRYSPALAALSRFEVYAKREQEAAIGRLNGFLGDLEAVFQETRGLVLYGSVGTGKDHLLAAALYSVARAAIPVSWFSGEDIYLRFRDSMDSGEKEEVVIKPFLRPMVLGISDPMGPTGVLGEWDARVLSRLLDRRYRSLRLTWLTMNAESEKDAKARLTPAIWDRFRDSAEIIPCFWPSYRERQRRK